MSAAVGRLSAEDREALLCDCSVALAVDACPVHSEDGMDLWTEKPAAAIEATVEQIVARHLAAFKAEAVAAIEADLIRNGDHMTPNERHGMRVAANLVRSVLT